MAQPEHRTLDPKLDVVFKILFASPETKGSLISLLTAVLRPASPIEDVKEDTMIEQAKGVLERLSEDPKVRDMVRWRESQIAFDRWQRRLEREEAQAEGWAEGRAEGEAEGEARGEARGKRDALLRLLNRRGIEVTEVQLTQIQSCTELSLLDQWFDQALTATVAEDLGL